MQMLIYPFFNASKFEHYTVKRGLVLFFISIKYKNKPLLNINIKVLNENKN